LPPTDLTEPPSLQAQVFSMSQFSQPNYEIPRITGQCAKTGRELQPGEAYYAALVEAPAPSPESVSSSDEGGAEKAARAPHPEHALGLMRVDVSREAWEEGYRPERLFSFWKTTVPEPNQKKKLFVDD